MTSIALCRFPAVVISLEEYHRFRSFQSFQREREAFFDWLEGAAASNAERNRNLSEEEVLLLIKQAWWEAYADT